TALNSPWDIVAIGDSLYVVMAGAHQIWKIDLKAKTAAPYAGSGVEGIADGPLAAATLAQPSGITTDGKKLYFADSEASAIRSADLSAGGKVETIVGKGLFDFGDKDGLGDRARLQHPLAVVVQNGKLYVADSYNHKIKLIDPATRSCISILGTGKPGFKNGPFKTAQLNEPG